ncbi:MAG: hypothetical protein NVV69_09765 [Methyloversatilis sp.]|uniref:hypothetical protein n=1 Tax=Methyloversatilis sp. TaxID=2569862 RepID=UPI0025F32259|nr:hypothetical protein [Methyloversatilis sp.]MCR6666280.1 hypothetical protein [Methyloversatilis sp.]
MTAFVAACIYLAFEHTIYVAESRVLIRVGKEKLSGIEPYAKDSYNILFQERGQDIHNGIELLRDESLAHAVFDKLRPYLQPEAPPEGGFARLKYEAKKMWASVKEVLYAPMYWFGFKTRFSDEENMVRALRGSLAVEAIEDTDILRVSFGWTDPQFAALALNTFTSEFVAKHIRVHGKCHLGTVLHRSDRAETQVAGRSRSGTDDVPDRAQHRQSAAAEGTAAQGHHRARSAPARGNPAARGVSGPAGRR